jgi:holo-[acyl-carrier protein] synthase
MNIFPGTDIVEIRRFRGYTGTRKDPFLHKVFTENELDYCFGKEDPAPHLAVTFAAKEAVLKALYAEGIRDISYKEIEICRDAEGVPSAHINNERDNLDLRVSLSHSEEYALAFALMVRGDVRHEGK